MKVMCISDIHGNIDKLREVLDRYHEEGCSKLIILGDFFSYYPSLKNDEIVEVLNNMASSIIAVEGNCDSGRNIEQFNFTLGYLKNIDVNGYGVTITHGHVYSHKRFPEMVGKIFLQGHSHNNKLEEVNGVILANPGSISLPRGGSVSSYIIIDEDKIYLKKLNGEIIKSLDIK